MKLLRKLMKNLMEKVYIYHAFNWHQQCLFNTNSTYSTNSDMPSRNSDMIFEVIVLSKNCNRFDSLNIYWEKFGARKVFCVLGFLRFNILIIFLLLQLLKTQKNITRPLKTISLTINIRS